MVIASNTKNVTDIFTKRKVFIKAPRDFGVRYLKNAQYICQSISNTQARRELL